MVKMVDTEKPLRSTETLYLRVAPAVRSRAVEMAAKAGRSVSDYVAALIAGNYPASALAVEVAALAVLGQRVVAALDELPREAIQARAAIVELRRAIIEQMLAARPEYDDRLDRPGADERWA